MEGFFLCDDSDDIHHWWDRQGIWSRCNKVCTTLLNLHKTLLNHSITARYWNTVSLRDFWLPPVHLEENDLASHEILNPVELLREMRRKDQKIHDGTTLLELLLCCRRDVIWTCLECICRARHLCPGPFSLCFFICFALSYEQSRQNEVKLRWYLRVTY